MTDPVKIIVGEGDITEVNVPEYHLIQTGGGGGSDGATFFPEVSQEGVISWTNDGGYDNPEPVNIKGPAGNDGDDGQNGVTFTPSVSDAGIISWTNDGDLPNPSPVNIKGSDGEDGEDGVSPAVTFGTITGGHTMTVTDKTHPTGQTINIMDGAQGQTGPGVPAGGTTGQVLAKKSNADNDTEWVNQSGGGTADALPLAGGTMEGAINMDGNKVSNLPTPTANGDAVPKSYADEKYTKPSGGIPQTDLASAVQGKLDNTVVVSDTQPTATENKLWVDTDAGAGSSYQVPTVAEMEAADAANAANISALQNRFPTTWYNDFNIFENVYQPIIFKLIQNSQHAPDAAAYVCIQFASSANYAIQLAFKTGATKLYLRAKTSGTWGAWTSLTAS